VCRQGSRAAFQFVTVERASAAKKAKSTRLKLFPRGLPLNKVDLVADRFQLAERLVVIEQNEHQPRGKLRFA